MPNVKLKANRSSQQHLSITEFIALNAGMDVDELSTDAQTLFGLLTLIIDIKYRRKCGVTLEKSQLEYYNTSTIKKVVADQVTPVDNGLLRH